MPSERDYRSAIADRLAEAVAYYETLENNSGSLDFAEKQVVEIQRLYNQGDNGKLRHLVEQFQGIDDCRYGSAFGQIMKLMAEFLDSIDPSE